jgi:hypothetical protein
MVLGINELNGDGNEQQKQDASHPHDDFPVDIRLAVAPEIVDPCRAKNGHDGANSQHEGDEGIEHGSDVKGEADKDTGDQKEKCSTDPSGDF